MPRCSIEAAALVCASDPAHRLISHPLCLTRGGRRGAAIGRQIERRRVARSALQGRHERIAMSEFLSHGVLPIAVGAVAVVLLLGLYNMMRGGSPSTSQKLMRLRVLLQFVAIVIIMATIWAMGR
jgi:hypothetical protein